MNKYELALVVDAKIEEDVRVATVEKAKDYVTKFGGNITNVDPCFLQELQPPVS